MLEFAFFFTLFLRAVLLFYVFYAAKYFAQRPAQSMLACFEAGIVELLYAFGWPNLIYSPHPNFTPRALISA